MIKIRVFPRNGYAYNVIPCSSVEHYIDMYIAYLIKDILSCFYVTWTETINGTKIRQTWEFTKVGKQNGTNS